MVYTESHGLLVEQVLPKAKFQEIVVGSDVMLKEGCENFFVKLQQYGIPCVHIFSWYWSHSRGGDLSSQTSQLHVFCFFFFNDPGDSGVLKGFKDNVDHILKIGT